MNMETRNVSLTLDKAKEFYNSGNEELKKIALQAFTKKELTVPNFTDIKTFEDACKAIENYSCVYHIQDHSGLPEKIRGHLNAICKLDIIRKALNGDWKPQMTKGDIYFPCVRFYLPNKKPSDAEVIGMFIADNQKYLLTGGYSVKVSGKGLGDFYDQLEFGVSGANFGLLCCKSNEIAEYMSKKFGKIIFDACYHHVGAYEWVD